MTEIHAPNLFFELLACLEPATPKSVSQAYRQGVTGACASGAGVPMLARDLWAMFLPGLPALGLQGEMIPLAPSTLVAAVRERLRYGVPVILFRFSDFLAPQESEPSRDAPMEGAEAETRWEEPSVAQIGRVIGITQQGDVCWQEPHGEPQTSSPEQVCLLFSHALRVVRAKEKGGKLENIRRALLRWLAFAAAFPERLPSEAPEDAPILASAEAFLREIAGKRKSPIPLRWKYAADCFAEGWVLDALDWLREATLREIHLPPVLMEVLLSSETEPLSDLQRRELIYLARAGRPALRALCAERLLLEIDHDDAYRTLEQLRYDPSYWVRAIVRALHEDA